MNLTTMLQFNTTVCTIITRVTPRVYWRFTALFATSSAQVITNKSAVPKKKLATSMTNEDKIKFNALKIKISKSLNSRSYIIPKIQNVNNLNDLLELIKMPDLPQEDILKVKDIIVEWVLKNNIDLSKIKDNKLHTILQEQRKQSQIIKHETNGAPLTPTDFSNYQRLSTSQMIKEICRMRIKHERNVKLLQFLFRDITIHNECLLLAECSDLVYSMSTLNIPYKRLLDKISRDIQRNISSIKKEIFFVLKSMGILKYKNEDFLNYVSCLILNSQALIKPKHILYALQSFALLGYESKNTNDIIEKYRSSLSLTNLGINHWLDLVWSLSLLQNVQPSDIESVLNNSFVKSVLSENLEKHSLNQLKLLNINGIAKYLPNYSGPLLNEENILYVTSPYTKQKEVFFDVFKSTLQAMESSLSFTLKVNTKMGFLLDAECYVNFNTNLCKDKNDLPTKDTKKIGIILVDYHSYCLDSDEFHGLTKLYQRLLKYNDYPVIFLSYKNFGIMDKISKRIECLSQHMQLFK